MPTRVCNQSATLIDNISSTETLKKYETGILLSSLSDHFPVFYVRDLSEQIRQEPINIKFRKINAVTMQKFENLLKGLTWEDVISEKDPKKAFEFFMIGLEA